MSYYQLLLIDQHIILYQEQLEEEQEEGQTKGREREREERGGGREREGVVSCTLLLASPTLSVGED